MRNPWVIPALLALGLSACGGSAEPEARRPESTPLLAAVSSPAGEGAADLRAGRLDRARLRFEATLARDPEQLAALNDLAVTYALLDRTDAARALLDEVVSQGGPRDQLLALVNLGELYALDGYLGAAAAHLETARSIDPSRPEPVLALALLADARGDRERALALAREALRLDDGGAARGGLVFVAPEERLHVDALLALARGDREGAAARFRELRQGRVPTLALAAQRQLDEP